MKAKCNKGKFSVVKRVCKPNLVETPKNNLTYEFASPTTIFNTKIYREFPNKNEENINNVTQFSIIVLLFYPLINKL